METHFGIPIMTIPPELQRPQLILVSLQYLTSWDVATQGEPPKSETQHLDEVTQMLVVCQLLTIITKWLANSS